MKKISQVRLGRAGWAFLAVLFCATSAPAEFKDVFELQTQVQLPVDSVQRLQSTLDARFGVLQNVLQQTASSTDQTSQTVVAIERGLVVQDENPRGKLDINAGQIQSLNHSVNELKSHVDALTSRSRVPRTACPALRAPSAARVGRRCAVHCLPCCDNGARATRQALPNSTSRLVFGSRGRDTKIHRRPVALFRRHVHERHPSILVALSCVPDELFRLPIAFESSLLEAMCRRAR